MQDNMQVDLASLPPDFALALLVAMARVAEEEKIPVAVLQHLLTSEGVPALRTLLRVAQVFHEAAERRAAPKPLPPPVPIASPAAPWRVSSPFFFQLAYVLPHRRELRVRFPDFREQAFEIDEEPVFEPILVCREVLRLPRKLTVVLVSRDFFTTAAEALEYMRVNRLRPALPEELLAFDATHPAEVERHAGVIALGALILHRSLPHSGVLCLRCRLGEGRSLQVHPVRRTQDAGMVYLAVSEEG